MQMRVADRPAPAVDGAAGPRGLSLLVQQVLGKPLDKTQQLSNWDRRPLGEEQLVYAGGCPLSCPTPPHPPHWSLRLTLPTLAADAYCLLEVYWALCREPARFHLPGALPWSLGLGCSERRGTQEPPLQKASASPRQVGEAPPGPLSGFSWEEPLSLRLGPHRVGDLEWALGRPSAPKEGKQAGGERPTRGGVPSLACPSPTSRAASGCPRVPPRPWCTPVFTLAPGDMCQPLRSWVVSVVFPASLLFSVLSTHRLQELSTLGALPPRLPPAPCPGPRPSRVGQTGCSC